MNSIGKAFIAIGSILVIIGIVVILGQKIGLRRIPGDIVIRKGNFTFFFPVVSSLILSLILTLIFRILRR